MTKIAQNIAVTVDAGYKPNIINFKQGMPAQLTFTRTSEQGCLDRVHSDSLKFTKDLPLNQQVTITIPTDETGEFTFSCGMNMFHGKVVIN